MKRFSILAVVVIMFLSASATWGSGEQAQGGRGAQAGGQLRPAVDTSVPADLRPLLVPSQSEMRLVVVRYSADRATLSGNYDLGGAGGRGGARADNPGAPGGSRGPGAGQPAGLSLSQSRIARLKRFDLDWQAALAKLNAGRLSAAARTDLAGLQSTIQNNLKQLETDTQVIAGLLPLIPFGPSIVELSEARIRMDDMDARRAAGVLAEVVRQIGQVRATLEAGIGNAAGPAGAPRVGGEAAARCAAAVDGLRRSLETWFSFYNGYDPLFMWWATLPYRNADASLQAYAAFLRDKGALALRPGGPAALSIAPAPPTKLNEVPDLDELLSLPPDEMTEIVRRFNESGGRAGRGAPGSAQSLQNPRVFTSWLAALQSLDFDALSRNAQVSYLYIRKRCEVRLAQAGFRQGPTPRKDDNSGITGPARGRDGLILDLQEELIPYTPEELIAFAEKEFVWCDEEKRKAAREMGFGDDWRKALEKAKEMHVPPGQQPGVIRGLLFEAIDYLRARDVLTIPQVASESLHMNMMSPERQLVNPFFTGGSSISVSYPTDTMEYEARLQSMRGNSTPLSHATAFHEMIPGHNFTGYMGARYPDYRARLGGTSFWGEGWPLYWEMMMYQMGFHDTPEEKTGALFWRAHRCARIIFSLKFHMGQWSPQECVDFLVDRVGFERNNAIGEVRRSFQGSYAPLYQAAYLLGGLQLRSLRRELVDTGQLQEKYFHDEIMRQGSMPIALLRLALSKQRLTRDMSVDWKFYNQDPRQQGPSL